MKAINLSGKSCYYNSKSKKFTSLKKDFSILNMVRRKTGIRKCRTLVSVVKK